MTKRKGFSLITVLLSAIILLVLFISVTTLVIASQRQDEKIDCSQRLSYALVNIVEYLQAQLKEGSEILDTSFEVIKAIANETHLIGAVHIYKSGVYDAQNIYLVNFNIGLDNVKLVESVVLSSYAESS